MSVQASEDRYHSYRKGEACRYPSMATVKESLTGLPRVERHSQRTLSSAGVVYAHIFLHGINESFELRND